MRFVSQRWLVVCLGLSLPAGGWAETNRETADEASSASEETEEQATEERKTVTVRNEHMEVFADDLLSAQFVATTADMFVERFSSMLKAPTSVSRPVLMNLIPAEEGQRQGIPRTHYYRVGYVEVNLSWGPEVRRDQVERAVVQGYLTKLSASYSGGQVHVPFWLEVAAQHLARIPAKPSHAESLAAKIRARSQPMRLGEIFGAKRGEELDPDFDAYAYWLLMFLEREGRGSGQMRNFLVRNLRGEPGLAALAATLGEQVRNREEAHLWWLVGLAELTQPRHGPVKPMSETVARVIELARFTFSMNGEMKRLLAEDLWEYRVSATLRQEINRRLQLIQIELATVHPFYHNSLLSLGRLLEAVRNGQEEEYQEALVAFRHDLRTGDELAADTRSILDDLAAELDN